VRGLLFSQGIRVPRVDAQLDLGTLQDWQGQSILAGLRERLRAELAHLAAVHRRILDLEAQRRKQLKLRDERSEAVVARLMQLRSLGANISWLLVHELFFWRNLRNRRQVGALAGLAPTPYASGDTSREHGISKAGIRSVRHYAIELAWLWLHFQPRSDLARWYQHRFGKGSSRLRRIGIVALARKLLIALWRYLEFDELPKGAVLKTT
jgi:transposase